MKKYKEIDIDGFRALIAYSDTSDITCWLEHGVTNYWPILSVDFKQKVINLILEENAD